MAIIDVLVIVLGLLASEFLLPDPGWAGRRSVYLGVAVVLLVTAIYTTWRARRTDWGRSGR